MHNISYILYSYIRIIFAFLLANVSLVAVAQQRMANNDNNASSDDPKKVDITPNVKAWIFVDNMSHADTISVDTLLNMHQINNPIWKNNIDNSTLGVLGSPSRSTFFPSIKKHEGNIFYNSLLDYIPSADKMVFYNTLTPYTNLTYQMGYPKRRSEEYVNVIFTQNINRRANIGFQYSLSTSIGSYDSQRTDQTKLRLWNSYDGEYYRYYLNLQYNRSEVNENGGIADENEILNPVDGERKKPEDIKVRLSKTYNNQSVYGLMFNHSLDLGHVTRLDADSNEYDIAPVLIRHTVSIDKSHAIYSMSGLANYNSRVDSTLFAALNQYIDKANTHDRRYYFECKNLFELKMTEEFNSAMKFGLRAFLGIDTRHYRMESPNDTTTDKETEKLVITFHHQTKDDNVVFVGGQIFKNVGEYLRWKAGAKFYLMGYRKGNYEVTGDVDIHFPVLNHEANIYGKAIIKSQSPEYFEKEYYSNHFRWKNANLEDATISKFEGGIRIPDLKLKLSAFGGILDNYIYFNENCLPTQTKEAVKVIGAYGEKHFSIIGFNSIIRLAWQHTSDDLAMPLPEFSAQATSFYEAFLFDVLTLQLGVDIRYHNAYFAPKYMPALMQYHAQTERKIGNYGFFDPFINFHLKRMRVYFKYEHVNSKWGSADYFLSPYYPAAPGTFKFGLSWNFYD